MQVDEVDLVGSLSLGGSVDGTTGPAFYPVDVILKHSDTLDVLDALTHNYRHTQPKESQYYNIHEHSIIENIKTTIKKKQ